jgi:membrane-bound lytic murein transglycosylase B
MNKARRKMKQHAGTLARIQKRYGVPPAVIVTIWGMETNFGHGGGRMNIIRSLATLAYDCRRSAFFTNELLAALRIINRGDMNPSHMRDGWAGEIGQTQFLASSYVKYAVDFDGNGHRDLIRSVPDVLASTANYLKRKGWRRGQAWGPSTANYGVLRAWNKANVYQRTMANASTIRAGRRLSPGHHQWCCRRNRLPAWPSASTSGAVVLTTKEGMVGDERVELPTSSV